jgi:hypothetical protein
LDDETTGIGGLIASGTRLKESRGNVERVDPVGSRVDGLHGGSGGDLVQGVVANGAALDWVIPPSEAEVAGLLHGVVDRVRVGDAALATAETGLVAIVHWQRK